MPEPVTPPASTPTPSPAPVSAGAPPSETPQKVDNPGFKVPEPYSTLKWAQDIKSEEDVWKKLAGAQEVIGRPRVVRPADDAPKDVWRKFHLDNGCPETPEGYQFKNIDALKDLPRDPNVDNKFKTIMHELGIPKTVGEEFIRRAEEIVYEAQKPILERNTKIEADFIELRKKVLGAEENATVAAFKSTLASTIGNKPDLATKLNTMDNDQLLMLTVFAKQIYDRYAKESTVVPPAAGAQVQSGDIKSIFQSLSSEKIAVKSDKNMAEHVRQQRLQVINKKMQAIGAQAEAQNINLFA